MVHSHHTTEFLRKQSVCILRRDFSPCEAISSFFMQQKGSCFSQMPFLVEMRGIEPLTT